MSDGKPTVVDGVVHFPTRWANEGEGCRCVTQRCGALYDMGLRWVTVMDDRVCDVCREMNGKLVKTDQRPPLHDCEHEPKGS